MKKKLIIGLSVAATLVIAGLSLGAYGSNKYEVSVTNLTRGQIMSPVVVASHKFVEDPLFTLGQPASEALAKVAEDAMTDDLVAALEANDKVKEVATIFGAEGPIMPGETASVTVEAGWRPSFVTAVSMLVTTNDAFFAVRGEKNTWFGHRTVYADAFDAGSEANSESCDFIPGPPCGNGGVHDPEEAEGYVHIHSGIHGAGDLDASTWDWRNPVAEIRISPAP